jgi:hypothetical protein
VFKFEATNSKPEKEPEKKVTLTALRKQLESLEIAQSAGYNVPPLAIMMVKEQIRMKRGVHSVWLCSNVRCMKTYELFVPAKGVGCGCGYECRQDWVNSQWLPK